MTTSSATGALKRRSASRNAAQRVGVPNLSGMAPRSSGHSITATCRFSPLAWISLSTRRSVDLSAVEVPGM
ncbi:MAG TPA: hypothetical protein VHX88_15685 [Solirubrobacteraceae bacterium]|jgi:hypothetical protein|nr:hypothetical protein [Solirubrobacteraceae bacterium]